MTNNDVSDTNVTLPTFQSRPGLIDLFEKCCDNQDPGTDIGPEGGGSYETKGSRMNDTQSELAYDSRPDTHTHIGVVRSNMLAVATEVLERAHKHDDSKLCEPELSVFNEYTPKLKDSTYGSPEYAAFLEGMGVGLKHHYAENDHHPEHFADGIAGMNLIQLTEMLCDWHAAVQRHADGDLRKSIEINADRFGYGDEIKRLLLNTVEWMEWVGL